MCVQRRGPYQWPVEEVECSRRKWERTGGGEMEWRVPTGEAEAVARKTTLGTVPLKKNGVGLGKWSSEDKEPGVRRERSGKPEL